MDHPPTRYAVLRDRQHWEAETIAGLHKDADGVLTLARLAGPADGKPIVLRGPYDPAPSGLAVASNDELFLADTANDRVIRQDRTCQVQWSLPGCGGTGSGPGQFGRPAGLLVASGRLYVADRGNQRVQIFRLPSLTLQALWEGPFQDPTGLALDSRGRIYVLDRGLKRVLRFSAAGAPDTAYNSAMAQAGLQAPAFLAVDGDDRLYVSDEKTDQVLRFDSAGQFLGVLPEGPTLPRALAVGQEILYVADADDGQLWVYDTQAQSYLGALPGFWGPTAALALSDTGKLYMKPGLDEQIVTLHENLAFVPSGWLQAGPLDAGEGGAWERVQVSAELPAGTRAELRLFAAADDNQAPSAVDWTTGSTLAGALDTLVETVPAASAALGGRRFLWLRITCTGEDPSASPRLLQVQAETTSASYLDDLPAVYRREDTPTHFLERWLALFRAELGDLEWTLEEMSRRFDPAMAPADHLPWLASWMGFELPSDPDEDARRALLARLPSLYERRGTPAGLSEFVELYSGVRPTIFEAFQERRIWQLGVSSYLGLDTALAAALPDGLVVPGLTLADPQYQGLRGDYYAGVNFEQLKPPRIDRTVDFEWFPDSPGGQVPADFFSVRWSGQVQPRYTEVYTFTTLSDDGVRLWVDGLLIIDNWTDHPQTENSGRMALTAGRWYPIVLEFYEKGGGATIRLSWSSRSQAREIIPAERLYALRDDSARLPDDDSNREGEVMLVGQAVVGQSRPHSAAEYGLPLFADEAHLFTVLAPAASVRDPARRQALIRTVEAEKPAHTDYHLCLPEARMRVGFQARIGIDSIIGGPPEPMSMAGTHLGLDSVLGDGDGEHLGRVGQHARIGLDTVIG